MSERFSTAKVERDWSDTSLAVAGYRELNVVETDVEVAGGNVLLAMDEDGYRKVLFPLGTGGPCKEDRRSQGVRIVRSELDEGATRREFVELECRRPALNDVFSTMVAEILNLLDSNSTRPDIKAGNVLNRWRSFFRAEANRTLDLNRTVGLLGELVILEDIVSQGSADVGSWTGPDMLRHDFTLPSGSIEVKTTTAGTGWQVVIHGERQLANPPRGELWMAAVRLEVSPEGNRSLKDQIERLKNVGIDESVLWEKLNQLDINESPAEQLERYRFNLVEKVAFLVDSEFPRLTADLFPEGGLPDRISDLRYRIDLNGFSSISIEETVTAACRPSLEQN